MKVLTKNELKLRHSEFLNKIRKGALFVHPTDTIYGISCDATNEESVKKIREVKGRMTNPFSIWVPSIEWIRKNCQVNKNAEEWLEKLPGQYTLILKLKNKDVVAKEVIPGIDAIGVRLPDHWFSAIVRDLNKPIITTSANKAGEPFMTSLENLDEEIKGKVQFIIYEGEKKSRPSKIIDLTKGTIKER